VDSTAFGAPFSTPRHAASVLRAIAVRAGLDLTDVDDVDCAAAVVGGDLWCRVTRTTNLLAARVGGPQRAAGRILARAAGYGRPLGELPDVGAGSPLTLAMLDVYEPWLEAHLGGGGALALARAGWDLGCGDADWDAAAATLQRAADLP